MEPLPAMESEPVTSGMYTATVRSVVDMIFTQLKLCKIASRYYAALQEHFVFFPVSFGADDLDRTTKCWLVDVRRIGKKADLTRSS